MDATPQGFPGRAPSDPFQPEGATSLNEGVLVAQQQVHWQTLGAALASRYTLDRELGRGGMATVYLARDVRHARQVAIKVLHPELAAVPGQEIQLGRENGIENSAGA